MKKIERKEKKQIANRFKEFRLKLRLTKSELSQKLKVEKISISNIEEIRVIPSVPIIIYLMKEFNLSPTWLLSGVGETTLGNSLKNDRTIDQEEIDDLLFHLENVPLVREFILKEFILFRFSNKKYIQSWLEEQEKRRKGDY